MSAHYSSTEYSDLTEVLEKPSRWLVEAVKTKTKTRPDYAPKTCSEVTVYAKIESSEVGSSVIQVAKWKAADIYGYADDPVIDLLNFFGELGSLCLDIESALDEADHELKTVELWQKMKGLNRFLAISPKHDELIATLHLLPFSSLGVIDAPKLIALRQVLSILETTLGLTDAILDQVEDILEKSGFDLQSPADFSTTSE